MAARLLIADDQPVTLALLRRELGRDSSLEICAEAINGAEAVAKAQEFHPDLIILDLAMPILNGLEAACEIRRHLSEIPILLFTLTAVPEVRVQAAKMGIQEVISKEDGINLLLVAIRKALKTTSGTASAVVSGEVAAPIPPSDTTAEVQRTAGSPVSEPSTVRVKIS